LDADIELEGLRGGGDGGCGVWGEWVVMGQDSEDTSACGAQELDAFEDASDDDVG
jgi:hypothetical protein